MKLVNEKSVISTEPNSQIDKLVELNGVLIREKYQKLGEKEIQLLINDVEEYVYNVTYELDSIEVSDDSIIELIERIKDLKGVTERNTGYRQFHRDYGVVEKSIIISNYFIEPLTKALCRMCDQYEKKLEKTFNQKSNQEKYEEIRQHIAFIPVALWTKADARYANAINYIDELNAKTKSKKMKENLCELKRKTESIKRARIVALCASCLPAIGLFVYLSILWFDHYVKNVLYIGASIFLSTLLYIAIFNIIIQIIRVIILGRKKITNPEEDY